MAKIYSINGGSKKYHNEKSNTDIYTLHTDEMLHERVQAQVVKYAGMDTLVNLTVEDSDKSATAICVNVGSLLRQLTEITRQE